MASLGTWPSTIMPAAARFMLQTNQRVNASPGGGSEQAVDMLNDRWMAYITLSARKFADAAAVEALIASFRGQVNTINLWHFARPTPRGTLSTSPTTLAADAAQNASSIQIAATTGQTVYAGDLVGAGGQILMISADATASAGVLTLSLVNRLRAALSSGAAVTVEKPTAPFRLLSHSGVTYSQGVVDTIDLTFGEAV